MKKIAFLLMLSTLVSNAQSFKDGKLTLNEDGSRYLKFTLLTQMWARVGQYNEGSTIFGTPKSSGLDLGIRRYRVQMFGQLTDRVFVYSQFGENNFNSISDRKLGFFVHDALGEYAVVKKNLSIGAGLSGWSGLSRFASPATGSILGVDAPLYQQSTNDATDQFLRKLSVYAKGKLGKIDYRIAIAQPMAIQKAATYTNVINGTSNYSQKPPIAQFNSYIQYQFKDQESNLTPYMAGTYLGSKKILNIGAGLVYQKAAMSRLGDTGKDTLYTNMVQLAADVFYDTPVSKNGAAINIYSNLTYFDFGKNYLRNQNPMSPTNGTTGSSILNGTGFGYPSIGTGTTFYTQAGYKFKNNLIGKTTLMPYSSVQIANYQKLNQNMYFYSAGVNWLLSGQTSKLTLAYENRPIFNTSGNVLDRKGAFVMQYQVFFN